MATITKLTRNLFLAGVIPGLTYYTARQENKMDTSQSMIPSFQQFKKYFPGFVAGFIAMSLLRSAGDFSLASSGAAFAIFDQDTWKWMTNTIGNDIGSHYLLGTAMVSLL